MNKLPVLFVTCNVENLPLQAQASSGLARILSGMQYDSVVLISTGPGLSAPEIRCLQGACDAADKIRELLNLGAVSSKTPPERVDSRQRLLRVLLADEPGEVSELSLNTGMNELEYRHLGQCLRGLREQGVLIICLDDITGQGDDRRVALHNRQLRDMIGGWVLDQQWDSALSFRGDRPREGVSMRLDDPTVCLLNAAFSLGDSKFPQRMFSSRLNPANQSLSGFGWMR